MDHIHDDALELYSLGRVAEHELVTIEEHLLICSHCCNRLQTGAGSAIPIREARSRLTAELVQVHQTADGPIYIYARKHGDRWITTLRGRQLDSGIVDKSKRQGLRRAHEAFRQLFPEHICSTQCLDHRSVHKLY